MGIPMYHSIHYVRTTAYLQAFSQGGCDIQKIYPVVYNYTYVGIYNNTVNSLTFVRSPLYPFNTLTVSRL